MAAPLHIVKRRARLTREIGLTHYTYRSDREPAIRIRLTSAASEAGIPEARIDDVSQPIEDQVDGAAVPHKSAPSESASNGAIQRAVQTVEDQLRTMQVALEHRLGSRVPLGDPIMRWMVEHAGMLLAHQNVSP